VKGKACSRRDSDALIKGLKKAIGKRGLEDFYHVKKAECFGLCKYGPIMSIDDSIYGKVNKDDCKKIVKWHAKNKKPLKRLLITKKK
jgi:NADH:ubiquinone oxidoreductase subunit E